MEYNQDDFLMLSGIQHFAFCRRQWALIHIEQLWEENTRTIQGELMHEKCHDCFINETRKDMFISRAVPVFSKELGISGECDVVEFHKCEDGISIYNKEGKYSVFPIEYKRGEPKDSDIDVLQLVAQAICLEEMLVCKINKGAIYYGNTKRRLNVDITPELRNKVSVITAEMHSLLQRGYVPKVKPNKSCNACSLKALCMPKLFNNHNVSAYIKDNVYGSGDEE